MEPQRLSQVIPAGLDLESSRELLHNKKRPSVDLTVVRKNVAKNVFIPPDTITPTQPDWRVKFNKIIEKPHGQFLFSILLALIAYTLIREAYAIIGLPVACSSFDAENLSGDTDDQIGELVEQLMIMSVSADCTYWVDYFSKVLAYWLIGSGLYSVWCAMNVKPGMARKKAVRWIMWTNVFFWALHLFAWGFNFKGPDGMMLGMSMVLPALASQCVAIYKYDKDSNAVKAQLVGALTLAVHSFVVLSFLAGFSATATREDQEFLLVVFPFHILLLEFLLVRAISWRRWFDNYDPDCGYGLAKIIISKLESLRLGFLMFSYTDELAAATVVSILISVLIEIITRTRAWLYALIAIANFIYRCWKPEVKERFKIGERKFFYVAYVNSKYEAEYIPLLAALMIIALGWAPVGTVGTVSDKWGTPVSSWYLPAWFFIAIFLSEVVSDMGTSLLTKYFHVDKIEFYRSERLSSAIINNVWGFGLAIVTLCEMNLVFVVKRVIEG